MHAQTAGPIGPVRIVRPGPPEPMPGEAPPPDMLFVAHGPMSVDLPTVSGAPFSADIVSESVQTLADGNRIRREQRSKLYRDSEGRTRREDTIQLAGPSAADGSITMIYIDDPVAKTRYVLDPQRRTVRHLRGGSIEDRLAASLGDASIAKFEVKVAEPVEGIRGAARGRIAYRNTGPAGSSPSDFAGRPERESLGTQIIEGVSAEGERTTTMIPAGKIGNEMEIRTSFERWFSPELHVDVLTKRTDPMSGESTYRLTNIQRSEPLPMLFEPPADYEPELDNPAPEPGVIERRIMIQRQGP